MPYLQISFAAIDGALASTIIPEDSAPDWKHVFAPAEIRAMQQDERDTRELLIKLRGEHRELDTQIAALEAQLHADQLQITRLKKKKLQLKDRITALEDQLLPDIIA